MQRELSQFSWARELSASQLKRSIYLFRRDLRAKVEPDGSCSWLHSSKAGKLLFGRETTEVFKFQSGVKIAIKPQDIAVRATPTVVSHAHRGPEKVQVAYSLQLIAGDCAGWTRTVRLTNRGETTAKLRVLTLHDPTSLNFRRDRDPPGEIGVNAFNRNDQVVMDDVGDATGVRVLGFSPRPSTIYMTKDRGRALELLGLGELPESSLGMSGSVILLTQHDLELPPAATAEFSSASIYHASSLEAALSTAALPVRPEEREGGVEFSSSSASVNFAFEWAKAALSAVESEPVRAERLWSGVALSLTRSRAFQELLESERSALRKDGTLRYSGGPSAADRPERPGPVETSLYLLGICAHLTTRSADKKLVRKWYPLVKKVGEGLASLLGRGLVTSPSDSPDGWRRRLTAGFPAGYNAEVNLLVLRALQDCSSVAYLAGKGSDSARFRELAVRLQAALDERLRDPESGALVLNVDARGIAHREITVDQAVGLSYGSPDQNLSSSVVHRLLEKDFETGYGPRTVPSSNSLYYSPSYAEGQLGGYWTRAAISHAVLAYLSGYTSIGSSQLERVARLVHTDAERLGGLPGEFPYWIDTERRQVMGSGSDPVAAARFVEAVIWGEVGLSLGSRGPRFKIPGASQLKWFLLHGLDLGRSVSLFVGRAPGRTFVSSTIEPGAFEDPAGTTSATSLPECERVAAQGGLEGLLFWDSNCSVVCVGNGGNNTYSGSLTLAMRSKSFSTSLFAQLEELQQDTGLWANIERVKLMKAMDLRLEVRPGAWRVLRLTRVAQ
jgi:hypothetical protein